MYVGGGTGSPLSLEILVIYIHIIDRDIISKVGTFLLHSLT
jgi:hypothetical protein